MEDDGLVGRTWQQDTFFNSHPHMEDDRRTLGSEVIEMSFQLTSSHGGWRKGHIWSSFYQIFNSHPHMEDDMVRFPLRIFLVFSTHILTWRMTSNGFHRMQGHHFSTHILTWRMTGKSIMKIIAVIFQLTSSQGGWRWQKRLMMELLLFNSHPHKEDDIFDHIPKSYSHNFQLTSSHGGWHYSSWVKICTYSFFNSHPHMEDDLRHGFCR